MTLDSAEVLKLLVIEDSENDYLLVTSTLRRAGFQLDAQRVETEIALRQALAQREWDLVIADFRLPEFDGNTALEIVRQHRPDTPFIIVSGVMKESLAAATLAGGANDALYKGDLTRLAAVVEREIKAHQDRLIQIEETRLAHSGQEALRDSQERFLQLTDHLPECFWLVDAATGRVTYSNEAYFKITGRAPDHLRQDANDLINALAPEDAERLGDALERLPLGGIDDEFRVIRLDGDVRWVHLRTFPVKDTQSETRGVGHVMTDITDRVSQQHQLQRMAHFDALTGLPNRILFKERLAGSIALARRNLWTMAVCFVDLDRFKNINDTLGHETGDELLREVAKRMRTVVRESDTVSRLGGDEFAVILPDLPDTEAAAGVSRKLIDALEKPFHLGGEDLFISASIGITLFPDDSEDADTLIRNADVAMYRAKEGGRANFQFYRAEMNDRAREMLTLEVDLRQALARKEFELFYQPKVSLVTGAVVGAEALIRWRSPLRGLVSPVDFIPLLEETGLIVQVGEWVLGEACRQAKRWQDAGYAIPVAVNLSARQFEDRSLKQQVRTALDASGLDASLLELELTESLLMRDVAAVEILLVELRAMGITLSVDDFGTGYSSLAYLKRFPINSLKIDRSFIRDITVDPDDASITRAVIHMAMELSLKVVAEGVESLDQMHLLAHAGCDEIQGFYFSRPIPAGEFDLLLQSGKAVDVSTASFPAREEIGVMPAPIATMALAERGTDGKDDSLASVLSLQMSGWIQHAIEYSSTAMVGVDQSGMVVFANAECAHVFREGDALVGRMALEALPPALHPVLSQSEGRQGFTVMLEQQPYWICSSAIVDGGVLNGWLVACTPAHRVNASVNVSTLPSGEREA